MKTRGKNKIFKCLRPATADDRYFKHSKSCDSFDFSEYSSARSEQGGGRGGGGDGSGTAAGDPKNLRHLSMRKPPADQSSDDTSSAPDDPNVRKGKFRVKFRRVLKAVFFEASLVRKLRKTESLMAPFRSRSSSSSLSSSSKPRRISRSESFSSRGHNNTESADNKSISRMNSDSSSRLSGLSLMTAREYSSSSSPCSSTLCYSPGCCLERNRRSISTKQQKLAERGRRYCWKVGCCCLILCLLALLFWGKALAILFISAWLYFAPLCFKSTIHPPPVIEPNDCMMSRNKFHHARRLSGF